MSEIQETYQILQQIDKLLADIELKITKIQDDAPKTESALVTFRQLERVALRYLAITRRMGLSDDVQTQIQKISELIMLVRMLQISYNMMMAGTPYGWAMAIGGFVMTSFAVADMVQVDQ